MKPSAANIVTGLRWRWNLLK